MSTAPAPPVHRLDAPRTTVQLPGDLADRVVAERMAPTRAAADFSRNLAVARIEIKDPETGTTSYELVTAWNLEKQHAEPLLLDKIAKRKGELKGRTVTITHLYTERIPCSSGRADCQWALKQNQVPRSNIYYSVEVPDGTLARKLESHYGPYRRNLPRTSGGVGEASEEPPKASPRGRPKGSEPALRAAATPDSAEPQDAAAPAVDQPAVADRATKPSQRMVDTLEPGGGIESRGTTSKGVPSSAPPEPRILNFPHPQTPARATRVAPPKLVVVDKGEHSRGRVTLDYDFTGGSKRDSIRMKSVDVADFFGPETRITRKIEAPVLRKLAAASVTTAASLLTGWGLGKIKEYFSGFIREAEHNFDRAFPSADARGDEVGLKKQKAALDVLIKDLSQAVPLAALNLSPKDIVQRYLLGLFEYERINLSLQDSLAKDLGGDLPDIYADIGRRDQVLFRISNNLEDAFAWILSHAFGAILPVYYASFDLWLVRGIFYDLAKEMSDFQQHIYDRQAEYQKLLDKLVDDLDEVTPWLNYYRSYYERNKNLL
jgi:hypothetical protein